MRAPAPTPGPGRSSADAEGVARFEDLRPGTYDVRASLHGFVDAERRGLVVGAGGATTVDVELGVVQFSTEVTVTTANRRDEVLLDVADATTVVDRSQIEDTGARTAKDVLIEQVGAGLQVHAGGGQGHVSINGIPNSGVLVLVDGRRVLGRDGNGNLNLEDFDLAGVERVEIVKGAGSALYGSDALGGVVNIVTRRATTPGLTNSLALTGGSYGDVRLSDTLGWRAGRGGISSAVSWRTYDGFDLSPSNPQTIGQPESRFRTATLNGDLRLSDRVSVNGVAGYTRRAIDNYFFAGPTQLGSVYNSQRELRRYTLSPDVDVVLGDRTVVSAGMTYGKYDRDERQIYPNNEIAVVPWQEWNREMRVTGRQTWRAFGREHFLQAGYEHRRERLDRASLLVPGTGERESSRGLNVVWLQQEVQASDRLSVAAGFRVDSSSDYGEAVSPKVSAVYALDARQRLRASYGKGFRAPRFNELYLNTPPFFVGNPDLRPERSHTVTMGYSLAATAVQASVDYFRAAVRDGITFNLSRLPYTYGNLTEYTSQGLNASASVTLPHGFVPSVSYSFVTRRDSEGRDVGELPRHSAQVKLLWSAPEAGFRVNLRGRLLDRVTFTDATAQPAY